ncbi:toll/interleukin-1 receptor domain-containing protein [Streptomyces purpureus]|uniref:TIR domain-containing protein n=1 Tax=Streptomyces purpureus TaxID=1951 RepID=A0A918LXK6_9ACTN|nr:toll/interleukin-1 receptor domain-containing protein [Streptomyces purpureus]GGT64990.1 hypothetical protein GCM10014713_67480 [Streptomyces purpureus]
MPEIFINYRTGDGNETAALLDHALSERFGERSVFFAGRSIKPGQQFPPTLLGNVRRCSVLVAVIGLNWNPAGRLHDEEDWVRKEILEAFTCGIPVVPVLNGRKVERLRQDDLPAELARLADLQSLRFDTQSHAVDVTRIGDELAELVPWLKETAADQRPEPARPGVGVHNSVGGDVHGTGVQARDITGDIGTVIKNNSGPIHAGSGDQHHHAPNITGDGAAYVAGDNHGGIRHHFGGSRRNEAGDR